MQSQPQSQTHTQTQTISKLKIWLKAKLPPSGTSRTDGKEQNSAAYRQATNAALHEPAELKNDLTHANRIPTSATQRSVILNPLAQPKNTTLQASNGRISRSSEATTSKLQKSKKGGLRTQSLIKYHGGAQKALIWAVEKRHQTAVNCLLDHGINDIQHDEYCHCLSLSLQQSNSALFNRLLVAATASEHLPHLLANPKILRLVVENLSIDRLASLLDALDSHGKQRVMCIAVRNTISFVVPTLLTMNVNPNTCNDGSSILPEAVLALNVDNICALLDHASTDVNALGKTLYEEDCLEPAIVAAVASAALDNISTRELLLRYKNIDFNKADSQGNTALHKATRNGWTPHVMLLLRNGADPNKTDSGGNTALHLAANSSIHNLSWLHYMRQLIDKGADLNKTNHQGFTALHLAANKVSFEHPNSLDKVKCLLEMGADIDKADVQGNTSLHAAAKKGSFRLVKLLLKEGANPAKENLKKQKAVDIADEEGHINCSSHIRERMGLPPLQRSRNPTGWYLENPYADELGACQNVLWPDRIIRDNRRREVRIVPPSQPAYWY
ncbi:MAG: hypothetical protein LQ342_006612 [Letrouitia transgressa]|nr:MAG: hypothetical protein LQ342_006612 [Letrouitia transgressa]